MILVLNMLIKKIINAKKTIRAILAQDDFLNSYGAPGKSNTWKIGLSESNLKLAF
jgi:hypothetical protein